MEPRYEITREQLANALQAWRKEAVENNWANNTVSGPEFDSADYLLKTMGFRV